MQLKHLRNSSIDYTRWDKCISESQNPLSYAYSWYLDVVSPKWEALVSEDYEYVMPLPVKSKYKISYLVQPILTQQLGIFSKLEINESIVEEFIKQIPYYSYELNLNDRNSYSKATILPNYILDLNRPYEKIASHYSKNTLRNIEKSTKYNLTIKNDLDLDIFLHFFFSENKHDVSRIQTVVKKLLEKGVAEKVMTLYGVYSNENNLIAALCVMHSSHRISYLLPISNAEGKISSAMFLLVDKLIHENYGRKIVLDFEGSSIEGIARFYRGFGAINQPYYILKQYRPSFLVRK